MAHSNQMYDIKVWFTYFFPTYQTMKVFFAKGILRKAQRLENFIFSLQVQRSDVIY